MGSGDLYYRRVNLKVPYSEKDQAKALGAQWDSVNKTWFYRKYRDDDMAAFERWRHKAPEKKTYPNSGKTVAITGPQPLIPSCLCNVLPWEDCEHTEVVGS